MDDYIDDLMKETRRSVRSLNGRLDNAAGKIGENYTMIDMASQGWDVEYVGGDHSKHYDIRATRGGEEQHIENKAGWHSDLSDAERETAKNDPQYRVNRTPRFMPRL